MRTDGIDYILRNNGYQIMESNIPMIKFFVKRTGYGEELNVIGCISTSIKNSFTVEQIENISFQIERKFLLTGTGKVNIIYFIYSDNVDRDKMFSRGNFNFWLVDIIAGRLIVYENQPDDFDGLKYPIQISLDEINAHNMYNAYNTYNEHDAYTTYNRYHNDNNRNFSGNYSGKISNEAGGNQISKIPFVTIFIILCNVVVFFMLESTGSTESAIFMLNHGAAYSKYIFEQHEYYRLFTSMFMHFGFSHLVNNMVSLWFIGTEVERLYGRIQYAVIYLVTGLAGSMVSAVFNYMSGRISISAGASGSVYGVLGALLVMILRYRKKGNSRAYRILVLLFFLMMAGQTEGNVDNMAHLGGLVTGIICGTLILAYRKYSESDKKY